MPCSHLELRLLFDLASLFDDPAQLRMLLRQHLILLVQRGELRLTLLKRVLQRAVPRNTRLLRQLLVLLVKLRPLVLLLGQLGLRLVKLLIDLEELIFVLFVLRLDILHLLTRVRQHDHMVDNLSAETGQLLVPLLNLLVERLVFNLQLLVIDQMKTFSKLLFLLQYFLLVGETVSERDVLQSILMNFLIFGLVGFFPLFDDLCAELLSSATVNRVHSH